MSRSVEKSGAELLDRRRLFEARLGHYLAHHPISMEISRQMILQCRAYVRERARRDARSSAEMPRQLSRLFVKIARPVPLPFSGRPRNFADLQRFLCGDGNIRELHGTVWLVIAHVIAEDLVGPSMRRDAIEAVESAGLNAEVADHWRREALTYCSEQGQRAVRLEDLRPNEDLALMPWHRIRQMQLDTRELFSRLHQTSRPWSLMTREQFEAEGGRFSRVESAVRSPIGRAFVPWLDAKRFCRVKAGSGFSELASVEQIPVATGISGVAMHTMEIAKLLNVTDADSVRLATLGYLMSTKAHSFYEIVVSTHGDVDPMSIPYRRHAAPGIVWNDVAAACREVPIPA